MFLIKCRCGCLYTLKDENLTRNKAKNGNRTCPNCGRGHNFEESLTVRTMCGTDLEITRIPNNAKITVTFDSNSFDC